MCDTLTKALSRFGWSKVPIGFTLTLNGEETHRLPPNEGTFKEWDWRSAWSALAGDWDRQARPGDEERGRIGEWN